MSELLHKQLNAHKESLKNNFRKVCDENESRIRRKKRRVPKIFFDGRREFIRRVRKTRVMDIKRLQVNDSLYIEGTICLPWGWFFERGRTNGCHKTRNVWYLGLVALSSSIVWLLIPYS